MRQDHRGFSLIEIVVALALAGIVAALTGSLFVTSLSAWRRGGDLREAQIEAVGLVDQMASDIRNATRAVVVAGGSGLVAEEGEPILLITARAAAMPSDSSAWILYLFLPERSQVLRQVVSALPGAGMTTRESRVVGRGILKVSAEQIDSGVALQVEARRGRARVQSRTTATPRNP